MPATIRWALTNCLLLWISMSLYRGLLLGVFLNGNPSEFLALLSGMLIDAGVLCLILVFYILLSINPVFHPFKTKKGKIYGYLYFVFWGLVIALIYLFDLIFVKATHYRMFGSRVITVIEDPYKSELFFKNISTTPIIFLVLVLIGSWLLIIMYLHSYVRSLSSVHSKTKRIKWQTWIITMGTILAIFAFSKGNKVKPTDLNLKLKPVEALRTNPVISLFFV